jgi:hypothetical protein
MIMRNNYGIPSAALASIRERDKFCVYCGKELVYPYDSTRQMDSATIEHLGDDPPFYWSEGMKEDNIVMCCGACNSSRGPKTLREWFQSPYCFERSISEDSVAQPVKDHLRTLTDLK